MPDQQQGKTARPATGRRALAGAAAALALLAAAFAAAQDIRFFTIGTGSTGGTYFPIGGMIASAISSPPGAPPCERGGSCGVPGMIAVAQASSGSVENLENIRSGIIDSGLAQSDTAFWAYTGTGLYENIEPIEDLRAISHLYAEYIHIVVPAESDIQSIADLRGRRVSLGAEGSGTLIDARILLEIYGLGENLIDSEFLSPEASSDLMLANELDAYFVVGGVPFLAVEDLAESMPIRLLPIDGEAVERLLEEQPFFSAVVFAEGTYPGIGEVPTVAVGADWLTSATLDEELVYGITRALWHPTTRILLDNGHARGAEIRLEHALRGLAVPLHPGAARYYREAGLLPDLSPPEPPPGPVRDSRSPRAPAVPPQSISESPAGP
ncbi:MAG: TAXI family TRAP transporter solute-binding subunit [Inquilinus sp.]|nr:TAXI family TRAP transporter solute-binding subunit [Inquilinus sp.]